MACSSCAKEWFFVADGVEHVAKSHFKALQLRKQVGALNAPIRSRKATKATK